MNYSFFRRKKANSLRFSVVFESDDEEENNGMATSGDTPGIPPSTPNPPEALEDLPDAPRELAIDMDEIEAEFYSIELAQEALKDILLTLEEKSKENRRSLGMITEEWENNDLPSPSSIVEEKGQTVAKIIPQFENEGLLNGDVQQDKGVQAETEINEEKEKIQPPEKEEKEEFHQPEKEEKEELRQQEKEVKDEIRQQEKEVKEEILQENVETSVSGIAEEDEDPNIAGPKILDEILNLTGQSYDKEVRAQVPKKVQNLKTIWVQRTATSSTPPKATPAPLPPPPPPPPPPLAFLKPPTTSLKKSSIKSIKINNDNVELRVKRSNGAPSVDLLNQLKSAFSRRKNRDSLRNKYDGLQ